MVMPSRRALAGAVVLGCAAGAIVGLVERGGRGPTGMGAGEVAAARVYAIGSQPGGEGWITLFQEGQDAPIAAVQVPWKAYNDEVGSAEVVAARLGNRRAMKLVVGLGAMPGQHGGWVVILDDVARGCSPIRWLHVGSPNDPPLATHVATGDIDGDGRDEIVVGVSASPGHGGKAYVFNDLRGHFAPLATLSVPWSACAKKGVETRPAVGDLVGDGKAEVVLGLGVADQGGWLAVYKDLKFDRWVRYPDAKYDAGAGETWPACGDVYGTGKASLLVGTGPGGLGRVAVMSDVLGKPSVAWLRVPWESYDTIPGEAHPQGVHALAGGRSQVLLGLRDFTRPTRVAAILDDASAGFRFLGWRRGWDAAALVARQAAPQQREEAARGARQAAVESLRERTPGGVAVSRSPVDGTVTYLCGPLTPPSPRDRGDSARAFLAANQDLWGIRDMDRDLQRQEPLSNTQGGSGAPSTVRYRQAISGVPVLDRGIYVHFDDDGSIQAVTANLDPTAAGCTIDATPSVSSGQAVETVRRQALGQRAFFLRPADICAWVSAGQPHLVWTMEGTSPGGESTRWIVDAHSGALLAVENRSASSNPLDIESTASGRTPLGNTFDDVRVWRFPTGVGSDLVLLIDDQTNANHVPAISTYVGTSDTDVSVPLFSGVKTLLGGAGFLSQLQGHPREDLPLLAIGVVRNTVPRGSGVVAFSEAQQSDAVAAHRNMGKVLQFWNERSVPPRLVSYDAADRPRNPSDVYVLIGVRFGEEKAPNNASAGGDGIVLVGPGGKPGVGVGPQGSATVIQGFQGSLDVLAHEFTHAVIANCPAKLGAATRDESGSLNEHIADVFGMLVEARMKSETEEARERAHDPMTEEEVDARNWMFGEEVVVQDPHRPFPDLFAIRRFDAPPSTSYLPSIKGGVFAHSDHEQALDKFVYLWVHGTHGQKSSDVKLPAGLDTPNVDLLGLNARQRYILSHGDPANKGRHLISGVRVNGLRPRFGRADGIPDSATNIFGTREDLLAFLEKVYKELILNPEISGGGATFRQYRQAIERLTRKFATDRSTGRSNALDEARKAFEAIGLLNSATLPPLRELIRSGSQASAQSADQGAGIGSASGQGSSGASSSGSGAASNAAGAGGASASAAASGGGVNQATSLEELVRKFRRGEGPALDITSGWMVMDSNGQARFYSEMVPYLYTLAPQSVQVENLGDTSAAHAVVRVHNFTSKALEHVGISEGSRVSHAPMSGVPNFLLYDSPPPLMHKYSDITIPPDSYADIQLDMQAGGGPQYGWYVVSIGDLPPEIGTRMFGVNFATSPVSTLVKTGDTFDVDVAIVKASSGWSEADRDLMVKDAQEQRLVPAQKIGLYVTRISKGGKVVLDVMDKQDSNLFIGSRVGTLRDFLNGLARYHFEFAEDHRRGMLDEITDSKKYSDIQNTSYLDGYSPRTSNDPQLVAATNARLDAIRAVPMSQLVTIHARTSEQETADAIAFENELLLASDGAQGPDNGGGKPVDATGGSSGSGGGSGGGGSGGGGGDTGAIVPPAITSPVPGSTLTSSSVTFTWTAGTGVLEYGLLIGSATGSKDLFEASLATSLSVSLTTLPTDGRTLFVQLRYRTAGGGFQVNYMYTAAGSSAGAGTGVGAVVPPVITSPVPRATLSGVSATFQWTAAQGATAYWLYVGRFVGDKGIFDSGNLGLGLSANVSGLPTDGSTVAATLYWQVGGAWQSASTTYTAFSSGTSTTQAAVPAITSPAAGSTLSGASVTFQWTAGAGMTAYWLYVGRSAGDKGIFDSGNLGAGLSATVSALPTDGSRVVATLYWQVGGAWQSASTPYTAFSSGTSSTQTAVSAITSPAAGSTLPGASVTFQWTAGAGMTAYWLYVGRSAGDKGIFDSGNLGLGLSATVSGLPTDGSTVVATLYWQVGGAWQSASTPYTAFSGGTSSTQAAGPAITSPAAGSTLSGASVTFQWTAGAGMTAYWLYVGRSAGDKSISDSGNLGAGLSTTVSNLPTDGSTVVVTLYWQVGGAWQSASTTYTAARR